MSETVLAYVVAASAGAYAAGIFALLARRWEPPAAPNPWLTAAAFAAFACAVAWPAYAFISGSIAFVCAAIAGASILRSRAPAPRNATLWRILTIVPFAIIVLLSCAPFFPTNDALAIRHAASLLLAVPAVAALFYWIVTANVRVP